jgi:hypothetical protein
LAVVYHFPLSLATNKSYTIFTSQSPTVSPRQQFPAAPKKEKIIGMESGFENEAGNEKERRGKGMN